MRESTERIMGGAASVGGIAVSAGIASLGRKRLVKVMANERSRTRVLKGLRRGGRYGKRAARSLSKRMPLSAGMLKGRKLLGQVKRISRHIDKLLLQKKALRPRGTK